MAENVDTRIDRLLSEVESIRTMQGSDPAFLTWRKRAEAAVSEKLGPESDLAKELRELHFSYVRMVWTDNMPPVTPEQHAKVFRSSMNYAVGILTAAREASPAPRNEPSGGPAIHVEAHGGSAKSEAHATVTVEVTTDQLRQLIALAPELTPQEKGEVIAAIPDDGEGLTLEKVDSILSIATKSKPLLKVILGWLLTHSDKFQWPV